ncbi:MAG: S1 family peptidase [Deltaproteobacteria bacterium]|nr:S1 family peptidase [Deltaproteobacteria bacterium]
MTYLRYIPRALAVVIATTTIGACEVDSDDLRPEDDDRVADGKPSLQGLHDFAGALYRGGAFKCTMVAIAPQWALSAAHCFYDEHDNFVPEGALSEYRGVVGRTDLSDHSDGIDVQFDSIHLLHPTDRPYASTYDLVAVHMTTAVPQDHVVELAPVEPAVGEPLRFIGYGRDENGSLPNQLRYKDVVRIECGVFGTFCGEDAVRDGDSGGPVIDARGRLVGINAAFNELGSKVARSVLYRAWIDSVIPTQHQSQYVLSSTGIRYRQGLTGTFTDYPSQYTPGNGEMQAITRFVAYDGGDENVYEYLFRGGDVWLRETPSASWDTATVAPSGHGWSNAASISDIPGCSSGLMQFFNTRVDLTAGEVLQSFGCDGEWFYRVVSLGEDYTHPWEAQWHGLGTELEWLSFNGAGGLGALRSLIANDAKVVSGNWTFNGPDLRDLDDPREFHYQSIGFDKGKTSNEYIGWYRVLNGENWEASWVGPFTTADIGPGVSQVQGGAVLNLR